MTAPGSTQPDLPAEVPAGVCAVIVVSLGEDPRLVDCLAALARGGGEACELCVIWNDVEGAPPSLPLRPVVARRRRENPGFSASVDEGLAATSAPLVLVLNPDTRLEPAALSRAVQVLEEDQKAGAVALRLLRPGGQILDSAGIRLGWLRRGRDRGMGQSAAGRFLRREPVDAACMAGALFRRRALQSARDGQGEILDRRFFAYKEDVDLGWRLRRAGWRVIYEPRARAEHERRWRAGMRRSIPLKLRRLSLRNRLLTILKNESGPGFLLRLPFYLLLEGLMVLYLLVREPRVLKAYPMTLGAIGATLTRRRLDP